MLKRQRTYRKTLLYGVLTVLLVTLLFGVLLVFSSAYFREKENREISNAILNKCIQETDSTLSSIDQMVTEFLLDNSHINQYMVTKDIERIEEYKMKQSLNRFNNSLNYYYGNDVSLYLFAPKTDRIYLNGALYKYSKFGHDDWVDQFSTLPAGDRWFPMNQLRIYSGYESFAPADCFTKSYNYPLGIVSSYGRACVLVPDQLLISIIGSSLPTESSQIYVLDQYNEVLYAAGQDHADYAEEMRLRKNRKRLFQWPASPGFYIHTSSYTGWQYVLRIPKSGIFSLWSPLGTLYALLVLLYCAGVSVYLAFLFGRPYLFIKQMVQLMKETIPNAEKIETDEFLELRSGFVDLNNSIGALRTQLDAYRFEVCNKLILDLITSERITSYEEHEQKMRQAGLKFYTKNYCALLICKVDGSRISSDQVLEKIAPLRDDRISFLCTQANLRNVLLLMTSDVTLEDSLVDQYILQLLSQFEDREIILGRGAVCQFPQELVGSYEDALLSVQYGITHKMHGFVDNKASTEDSRKNVLGERILQFVEENYSNPDFSLKMMESYFSMTASHLARVFKEHTGETIQGYLTRLRVEKAEQLMEENPREPLEKIAEQVGYVNTQALNRAFKKERGMPPRTSSKTHLETGG